MTEAFVASETSQCRCKQKFPSAHRAWKAAKRHNSSHNTERKVEAYRCPHCGNHHIGGRW